jgi:hypothetical protein
MVAIRLPIWLVCALPLLVGCSVSANPYAVHPDTITALRSHTGKSVRVSTFTSDKPGKSEIICRAVGMVQTAGGVPFEQYVQGLPHGAACGRARVRLRAGDAHGSSGRRSRCRSVWGERGGACRRTADESEPSDRPRTGVNGP